MQISKKDLPNQEIELTVTLSPEIIAKHEKKTADKLSQKLNIPGFRKGNAPINIVKKHTGEEAFLQYVLDSAIPDSYIEAIKAEKITPVARPQVELLTPDPVCYKAVIAIDPKVVLKSIDSLKIKRKKVEITKEELDGTIYELRKYQATYTDVETAAKSGNRVEIDFEGFDEEGKSLDGTKSKNHPLVLGDNQFVPGFEDNLTGMKKGENKSFTVTFPKDYHKEDFQKKKVKFDVTVNRIEEMVLPELNEELSEKILGKKLDKAGLLKEIESDIKRQKDAKEDQRQQTELFEKLLEKATLEVSDLIIKEELEYMLHQQRHDVEARGISWEQFTEMLEKQGRSLEDERRPEADQRVKARYIIRELIKQKDLKIDAKDVEKVLVEKGVAKKDIKPDSQEFIQEKDRQMLEMIFSMFLEPAKK